MASLAPTASAGKPPPKNTSLPVISGTAAQGQTLTASTGTWTGQPTSFSYQWRRCDTTGAGCGDIGGATGSTYVLGAGDVGSTLRVVVTATSSSGSTSATSQPTSVVQPPPQPPANTSPPSIAGTAQQNSSLTASPGTWSGTQPITYAYQWLRCGTDGLGCGAIVGATAQTYLLTAADVGWTVRVDVTATNLAGSADAVSAQTDVVVAAPAGADPIIATAGDIACDPASSSFNGGSGTSTECRELATSNVLTSMQLAAVLPLGDEQYECGGYNAFVASYDPSWGRVKSLSRPVPGNREYQTSGGTDCDSTGKAAGYFSYFGALAGSATTGYYSYDVGSWHLIALNSNCSAVGGCSAGSPQEQWLKNDLATHPAACTIAYWHHPRFSSGTTAGTSSVSAFWDDLYAAGAEIVLNGHAHDYERFDPQTPTGTADPQKGIREFIVGTGGKSLSNFSTPLPNSVVRSSSAYGVLTLTLHSGGYDWSFVPASGSTLADSGSAACH